MAKKDNKQRFVCSECGHIALRWMGRCPECGGWDTLNKAAPERSGGYVKNLEAPVIEPVCINDVSLADEPRTPTGISEFDRVLGGGIIPGSLVLVGGDPGIGKSTLMLQALASLSKTGRKVLYVSGEESIRQLAMRSRRIGEASSGFLAASETDIDSILATAREVRPDALVIDSIQTMYSKDIGSAPGSVSQVREATMKLMATCKETGIPVFIVGHVTKDGAIAGPRIMEHMVDTVLYFEGDKNHLYRILRAVKNRFGATNEIGVFEMKQDGLAEVPDPSSAFIAGRTKNVSGSVVTACMEGSRPILVEIQALISTAGFQTPRRTVLGLDYNRVSLLVAVIEKWLGLVMAGHDIFVNVAGGVRVGEPAADLAVVAAMASSFLDRPVPPNTIPIGEVGLTGEIRGVGRIEARLAEAAKMGFETCIIPASLAKRIKSRPAIRLVGVSRLAEVMKVLFS